MTSESARFETDTPAMFDRIARTYDLINSVLSFGQHTRWRKAMVKYLPAGNSLLVLDLACGTADIPLTLVGNNSQVRHVTGVDLSDEMLTLARVKVSHSCESSRISLVKGDALALEFAENSFDAVTSGFGLRNMPNLVLALMNAHRVLRSDGRLIVLEFSKPENILVIPFYLFYMNFILPLLGGLLSRDFKAYHYLTHSIQTFPQTREFKRILEQTGFEVLFMQQYMLGSVNLITARKAS